MFSLLAINAYDTSSRPAEISLDSTKKQGEKRERDCTVCLLACLSYSAGRSLRGKKEFVVLPLFSRMFCTCSSISVGVPEGLPFCEVHTILFLPDEYGECDAADCLSVLWASYMRLFSLW